MKLSRPVDRIDHPRVIRGTLVPALLFAADAVTGVSARDVRANHVLGGAIGHGDRVVSAVIALVLDVQGDAEMRENDGACGNCRAVREFEKVGRRVGRHAGRSDEDSGAMIARAPDGRRRNGFAERKRRRNAVADAPFTAVAAAAAPWRPTAYAPTRPNCRAPKATPPCRRAFLRAAGNAAHAPAPSRTRTP